MKRRRSHNYPPDLILEKAHRQGVENQQRLGPITESPYHHVAGYVPYDMAVAFENDQVTHEELFEEADRNKQIRQVIRQERDRLAAASHYWR